MKNAWTTAGIVALVILIFFWGSSQLDQGERSVSPLENIYGIPFYRAKTTLVTEALAHADISLTEPVFAKKLMVTVGFYPDQIRHLSVGVRENSFWLSYPRLDLYNESMVSAPPVPIIKTVAIPLTDKLQESDRSIDLMFFAEAIGEKQIQWRLDSLSAHIGPTVPTRQELKDYVRAILKRERPL